VQVFPTVIAFSYFLPSDVALSLGISKVAWVTVAAVLVTNGVDVASGNYFVGTRGGWFTFGAFLGLAIMLAYTGRDYYRRVGKAAFAPWRGDTGAERTSVWGARVFAASAVGMVALLMHLGLDWLLAVLTVLLLFLMFLGMARISAETGLFYVQTSWQSFSVILGLFGAAALGPKMLMILGLVAVVLAIDPRECLMPFAVNTFKMCDDSGVRLGRAGWSAGLAILLGFAVAVPTVLWVNYNFGSQQSQDLWANKQVPEFTVEMVSQNVTNLKNAGWFDDSLRVRGLERFAHMRPAGAFLWWAGAGLVLVCLCNLARLRFPWWPIHPILFLVWFPNPLNHIAWSFFLGWCVRAAVVKFGGTHGYERGKAFMVGVITGDVLGGLLFMGVGLAYYLITGTKGPNYYVLPT
jgi:hypothetical protein